MIRAFPLMLLCLLLPEIRQGVFARMEGSAEDDTVEELSPPFTIVGNFPNPFRGQTRIAFQTEVETLRIRIELFNINGVKLREIFDQEVSTGEHEVLFHPEGLASGVYFYRFSSSGFEQVRQMLFVR